MEVQAKDTTECVVVPLYVIEKLQAENERLRARLAACENALYNLDDRYSADYWSVWGIGSADAGSGEPNG